MLGPDGGAGEVAVVEGAELVVDGERVGGAEGGAWTADLDSGFASDVRQILFEVWDRLFEESA
jgi:hypothetical protein